MVDNGALSLFDRVDYYIGGCKIDSVRKPFFCASMKGLVSFERDLKYITTAVGKLISRVYNFNQWWRVFQSQVTFQQWWGFSRIIQKSYTAFPKNWSFTAPWVTIVIFFMHQTRMIKFLRRSMTWPELYFINMIKVKCNLIRCNFQDLQRNDNTIYEFPLICPKGVKIVERPGNISYYRVITDTIDDLSLRIVGQNNRFIDFHTNQITVTLDF